MKNEKKASVLSSASYTADDLTLYNDKSIKATKKHNSNQKPSYIESLSFTSDSKVSPFSPISYDLNTLDIDLNLRSNSIVTEEYGSSSDRFQALDAQYDFDCNYAKSTSEIHAVADLILKRKKTLQL